MYFRFQFVLGSTGYFFNWLAGYLYTNFNPSAFIYYGMVCGYVVLLVLIVLQVIASCCASKVEEPNDDVREEISGDFQAVYQSVKTGADVTEM